MIKDAYLEEAREIVDKANKLARLYYRSMGCVVDEDYKFYEADHPQEVGCWNMAVMAYEFIEGTEVEDALNTVMEG